MDKKFIDITSHSFEFVLKAIGPIEREKRLRALRETIDEQINKGGSNKSEIIITKHI